MTTLTAEEACGQIALLLQRAASGEAIGIDVGGKLVALRPIEESDEDYVLREYGLTPAEMDVAAQRLEEHFEKEKAAGKFKEWKPGQDFDAFLEED